MKIALLGTRGVPARYGGFETAVEEIGAGLAARGHEVVIYCRADGERPTLYRGMQRVVLPAVHRKAVETLTHTAASTAHVLRNRPDVAVVFNAANAPFVAALRAAGLPVALHVDGHDGKREKWRGTGQRYYSMATRIGARVASAIITDSRAMGRELAASHDIQALFVAYGARATVLDVQERQEKLDHLGLTNGGFDLLVARFEPENHVLDVVQAYVQSSAQRPLVVVGFAGFPGHYARRISDAAAGDDRVIFTGPIWDQDLLDCLYAGGAVYWHGHSVGGTNPSLLRAMVHGTPISAFDCPYNRETTDDNAVFFETADLPLLVDQLQAVTPERGRMAEAARSRAVEHYTWDIVVRRYEQILEGLVDASRLSDADVVDDVIERRPA